MESEILQPIGLTDTIPLREKSLNSSSFLVPAKKLNLEEFSPLYFIPSKKKLNISISDIVAANSNPKFISS